MSRPFWRATAEAVAAAIDAVSVAGEPKTAAYVADFTQLTPNHAEAALDLAADLGLLQKNAGAYSAVSPLCRSFRTASQRRKAVALRIVLEEYEPFWKFRDRLIATSDASAAAKQVKQLLGLTAHHDEIRETLVSLGQFTQAIVAKGGGVYRVNDGPTEDDLKVLAAACSTDAAAEQLVQKRLGPAAAARVDRANVTVPLANAIVRARAGDGRGAVVEAGNAVESYLSELANRVTVNLAGKTGLNAKAAEIARLRPLILPTKILNVSRYLGHLRNAADHGIDNDVSAPWEIRAATGLEYFFVACSFIRSATDREQSVSPVEL